MYIYKFFTYVVFCLISAGSIMVLVHEYDFTFDLVFYGKLFLLIALFVATFSLSTRTWEQMTEGR